jgi:hypothetical protein
MEVSYFGMILSKARSQLRSLSRRHEAR